MVDEAKAFCPGCGHAFVEEQKRSQTSNFEAMDSTVQLGQTMYNQMLSDMGLNISKAPDPAEKRVEVLAPVPTAPTSQPVTPARASKSANSKTWMIVGAVIVVLLLLAAAVVGAAIFIYLYKLR